MKTKAVQGSFKVLDEESGTFEAIFSRFNVIDHDRDVTLPGAFKDGQSVRISFWGHRWQDLPVGKGTIYNRDDYAIVKGKFFLDTDVGLETYKTVKNLGDLQEWSYGFEILESESGTFEGEEVTLLKSLDVFEVSPVFLGAGIGTMTTDIKGLKQLEDLIDQKIKEALDPEEKDQEDETSDISDQTEGEDEGEASDGKPSGYTPEVIRVYTTIELD